MIKLLTNQLFIGLLAGLALGYFFFHNCNQPKPCPEIKIEQTTTSQILPKDSNDWHAPLPVVRKIFIPKSDFKSHIENKKPDTVPSSASDYLNFSDDVSSIVADYAEERNYSDTNHFKEGDVIVQNTVTENKLQKQRVFLQNFRQTIITNVVTKTETPPKKVRLFWNVTAVADPNATINAAGGGLTFQFKDTRQLQVNYLYQFKKLYPGQNSNQIQITLLNPFSKQ